MSLNCVFFQSEELTLARWQDKRIVTMISNTFRPSMIERTRFCKGGVEETISMPVMVSKYRKNMGDVDLFDQSITY